MSENGSTRRRKEAPIERPGPSVIIKSGADAKGRERFRKTLRE